MGVENKLDMKKRSNMLIKVTRRHTSRSIKKYNNIKIEKIKDWWNGM